MISFNKQNIDQLLSSTSAPGQWMREIVKKPFWLFSFKRKHNQDLVPGRRGSITCQAPLFPFLEIWRRKQNSIMYAMASLIDNQAIAWNQGTCKWSKFHLRGVLEVAAKFVAFSFRNSLVKIHWPGRHLVFSASLALAAKIFTQVRRRFNLILPLLLQQNTTAYSSFSRKGDAMRYQSQREFIGRVAKSNGFFQAQNGHFDHAAFEAKCTEWLT